MAEYLAPNTVETAGAEFVLVDGASSLVSLKPANNALVALASDAIGDVQLKTSDAGWINVRRLTATDPAAIVTGPGTFRAVRRAVSAATGMDRS